MAQEEFDPLDLLSKVAMMVLEARTPDCSPKGRVEGPHCPQPAEQKGQHQCSPHVFQCFRAQEVRQRIGVMWRNGIPSCVDVLLLPGCIHGKMEADSLDGAGHEVEENVLLLERWSIKCIKKWHGEWVEGVAGSMLLQAVKSYLYFSQLSSWLNSMHGQLPGFIAYRLYAPGDCGDMDFTETPLTHKFPSAIYGRHGLKVTVLHLPRLSGYPELHCTLEATVILDRGWISQNEEDVGAAGGRKRKQAGYTRPKKGSASRIEGPREDSKNDARFIDDDSEPCLDGIEPLDSKATIPSPQFIKGYENKLEEEEEERRQRFRTPVPSDAPWTTKSWAKDDSQKERILAAPDATSRMKSRGKGNSQKEVKAKKSSTREALEGQLKPLELTPPTSPPSTPSLDLHSPKVLMSEVFYNPLPVSHRMQLDFSQPHASAAPQAPDDKQLLVKRFGQGASSPLSPLDLSVFLCNLQSLSAPISPHPFDPSHHPLTYQFSADKAARLGLSVASLGLNAVHTPPTLPPGLDDKEQHSARFRKKRALPFGGDPPPKSDSALRSGAPDPSSKLDTSGSDLKRDFSKSVASSACTDLFSLHGTDCRSSEVLVGRSLPRKEAQKKGKSGRAPDSREDGADRSEERGTTAKPQKSSELKDLTLPHSTSFESSSPLNQTLRDLSKIVQASKTQTLLSGSAHLFTDALSNSWSSSSSSSSSTFSSSPKAKTEGGDRHSDSSTPTNLSTSPLPEDQQSASCQAKPRPRSPHLCPHVRTATSSENSQPESSGEDKAEAVSDPDTSSLSLIDIVNQIAESEVLSQVESLEDEENSGRHNCSHRLSRLNMAKGLCTASCDSLPCEADSAYSSGDLDSLAHGRHSIAPPVKLPPEDFFSNSNHAQKLCPSQEKKEHAPSCEARSNEMKSPCMFYLESLASSEHVTPATSPWQRMPECGTAENTQWQSVSDAEIDSNELATRLDELRLQQRDVTCQSTERSPEKSVVLESQSNGCAVDGFAKHQSRTQSNGCNLLTDIAQDCSQSSSSGFDPSAFLPNQQTGGCESVNSSSTHRLSQLFEGRSSPSVSIANSSLVPTCQGKSTNQKQPSSKNGVETHSCDISEEDQSLHQPQSNGAATTSSGQVAVEHKAEEDEGVFYDESCDVKDGSVAHCPTRSKSSPGFLLLERSQEKEEEEEVRRGRSALRDKEGVKIMGPDRLRHRLVKSASMLFNARGSLPSQSSPAPIKRRSTGRFDYDETLTTTKAIKNAISMSRLPDACKDSTDSLSQTGRVLSTSAPASTNCLLGNFEESILNGRLEPAGVVDGFSIDVGASGEFCPRHVTLPVTAYFFNLSDDNAPSPYLGHINLDGVGKRGYRIPTCGTLQVTLFNPNRTVVKMFVVKYDLKDMPANSQTVLRQRTVYQPVDPHSDLPSYLRYLIHLRISSSSSGKTYLHTDIRLIFARHKFELDGSVAQYELRSYTETPVNPKYSPKR